MIINYLRLIIMMKRFQSVRIRISILMLLCAIVFFQNNSNAQSEHTLDSMDTTIVNFMETYHIPGLSALIIVDEEVIWEKQYGWSTIGEDIVTDSTIFVLASSCKTVIVTALMQLWENGEFDLDDNINNYLPFEVKNPNFPNDSITFKMLLTHTSSIKDNWSFMQFYNGDSPIQLAYYLENYFTPGGGYYDEQNNFSSSYAPNDNHWEYSNIGASLAAYLVETITGIPFDQYCNDNIFSPLGMENTSWFLAGLNNENLATPYGYDAASNQYYPYFHWGVAFYPAGQLRSTPSDISKFIQCYMNYGVYQDVNILDSSTVDLIITTYVLNWQGLIWRYQNDCWWHTGRSVGCSSMMSFSDNHNVGITYTTNMEIPAASYDWRWDLHNILKDYADNYILTSINEYPNKKINNKFSDITIAPNPFSSGTFVDFSLTENELVKVEIIDSAGNKAITLLDNFQEEGNSKIYWNGNDGSGNILSPGVYYIVFSIDNEIVTRKLLKINQ